MIRTPFYQNMALGIGLIFAFTRLQGGERPKFPVLDYLTAISGKSVVAGIHNREPNSQPALQTKQIHQATGKYP